MHKVLMLACYFPPFGGMGTQRILKFVKYIKEFGFFPYLITLKEDYALRTPQHLTWFKPQDPSLLSQVPKDVRIVRTSTLEYERLLKSAFIKMLGREGLRKAQEQKERFIFKLARSLLEFPDEEAGWIPFAVSAGTRLLMKEDFSLIYTTSPPHSVHISGYILKLLFRLPWVVDFRDGWTADEWYHPPMKWRRKVEEQLEGKILEYADAVVCNTPGMRKDFLRKYPHIKEEKFVVIPNGFDEEDFLGKEKRKEEKFLITYTGTVRLHFHGEESPRYNPKNFLKALSLLLKEVPSLRQKMKVRFLLYPREVMDIKELAHNLQIADVLDVREYMLHKECVEAMLSSSCLLLLHHCKNEGSTSWIPAKVYEYLRAGLPILALVPEEGDTATLLRTLSNAWIVPPEDIQKIKEALSRLFHLHEEGGLSAYVDEKALFKYERRHLTERLANLFQKIKKDA